jgi:PAS domain S-box-containing protein
MSSCILKPAAADLQSLFHHTPLPYLILEGNTAKILKANAAAATFFGCTPPQLESRRLTDFLVMDKTAGWHGLLKEFQIGTTPFLLSCKTESGPATVQVFQNPIPAEEAVIGIVLVPVTGQDGTPQPPDELICELVNETSDILTAADLEFKPLTWSKAAERLYGLSREQILGKTVRAHLTDIRYNNATVEEVRRAALATGKWRGEMSFTRPVDGRRLTLLITFKLIRDKKGEPLHYIISGTDITDRKEAEAKLRESENRFREMADSAPVGIWMSEVQNKLIYINKPLARFVGVEPKAFTKAIWVSLIHPDDAHGVLGKLREHFQKRLPVTLIYRLKLGSGPYHWVQDSSTPRFLSDGTFLGYIGSVVDINNQKQREAELQYQATLMNNVLDSVVTTDMNFIVQSWNGVAEEIYSYRAIEVIGKRLPKLPHFKYISAPKEAAMQELKKHGVWKGEIDITVKGEERNFLFTVTYVTDAGGARIGVMAVGREITDRKRAEKALQESELFYRNLITNSLDCILLTDAAGTITFSSASIKTILGYDVSEALNRNMFEFVHPDDQVHAWTAFQHEVSENPEVKFIQIRILKKDGTWLWCMVRGHNLLDNPHIGCIAIYLHDDSQRKQATDALKESEQRFRVLIKDLKLGVTLENGQGELLMCNKAATDLFGVSEAALQAANVYDLFKNVVHEDGTPFNREEWPMLRAARTGQPVDNVVAGVRLNSGNEAWLLVNSNPVLDEWGAIRHIVSSFSDVTERKKLVQRLMEEQVSQQRLLTQATIDGQERERKEIGKELHDNIGQQLTTTKLYLDLAQSSGTPDAAAMLNRATQSISGIINEVRAISHSLVPSTLGDLGLMESIHELVKTASLVQHLRINLNTADFSEEGLPENGKLMLYRVLQEALNNIIKHAGASMVQVQLLRNSRMILLRISDNGQGFVTEQVRKGLGLNNIRNRAALFGGKVTIKAAPGAGCTLKVSVPAMGTAEQGT